MSLISLGACQQLMHGQKQPVKLIDAKNNIYLTTCTGAVEDMSSCDSKARETCIGNYVVIKRFETISNGGFRELTFQCVNKKSF